MHRFLCKVEANAVGDAPWVYLCIAFHRQYVDFISIDCTILYSMLSECVPCNKCLVSTDMSRHVARP
jgi:hypothetical protein